AANPLILFNSPRLNESLSELHQHADLIIVAAPALLNSSESLILAQRTDAALLVMRAEATTRTAAAAARTILDQAHIWLAGVVLTGATDEDSVSFINAPLPGVMTQPAPGKHLLASLTNGKEHHSIPVSSASAVTSHSLDQ
ncbi:MAG: lipopolysaccharide biosynthesis protein, partial [Roseiflexaceae bacterium]|nr:lipopolysaccharide biosynthesis protein [Roseiflexaceae bacterium]